LKGRELLPSPSEGEGLGERELGPWC